MATISVAGKKYRIPKNAKAQNMISGIKAAKNQKCYCGKRAFYKRIREGRAYCSDCFLHQIEKQFRRTVRENKLITKGESIAVALSGSKDSSALLCMLVDLAKVMPVKIIALTADEGIKGYRPQGLSAAKALCKKLGIQHNVVRFKDEFDFTMDGLSKKLAKELPWCSWCGVLRRRALNNAARKLGCQKLAIGHTLDDEVQSILLGFVRGDFGQFSRLGFSPGTAKSISWVQRIKPLREIPESETALYALLQKIKFSQAGCPHSSETMRKQVRAFLNDMEERYPGVKHRMLRFYDNIKPAISKGAGTVVGACETCGEPSSGKRCRVCDMIAMAKK